MHSTIGSPSPDPRLRKSQLVFSTSHLLFSLATHTGLYSSVAPQLARLAGFSLPRPPPSLRLIGEPLGLASQLPSFARMKKKCFQCVWGGRSKTPPCPTVFPQLPVARHRLSAVHTHGAITGPNPNLVPGFRSE